MADWPLLRAVSAAAIFTSNPTIASAASYTTLTWQATVWDTDGFWSNAAGSKLTIPFDGYYRFAALAGHTASATGDIQIKMPKNGGSAVATAQLGCNGNYHPVIQVIGEDKAQRGDYYEVAYGQVTGGSLDLDKTACWFIATLIGGA